LRASHTRHPPQSVSSVLGTRKPVHSMHAPPGVGVTKPAGQAAHRLPATSSWPPGHCGAGQVAPAGHSAAQVPARGNAGVLGGGAVLVRGRRGGLPPNLCTMLAQALPPAVSHPCCWAAACRRNAALQALAQRQPALTARGVCFVGLVAGEGAGGARAVSHGVDGASRAGVAPHVANELLATWAWLQDARNSSRAHCSAGASTPRHEGCAGGGRGGAACAHCWRCHRYCRLHSTGAPAAGQHAKQVPRMQAMRGQHPPQPVRSALGTWKPVHWEHAPPGVGLTVPVGHAAHTLPAASSRPAGHWGAGQVVPAGHSAARAPGPTEHKEMTCDAMGARIHSLRMLLAPMQPPVSGTSSAGHQHA
jgi:hypothetical protein